MPSHRIRVRHATVEDLSKLPAVEAAADAPFADIGIWPLPPPGSADDLATARFVLVTGEPPVGFARVEEVDGQAHLEQLSVHPDHSRRGIGTALLEAAFVEALQLGYTAMTLITFTQVPWNAPFYARHGFHILDTLTPGLQELRQIDRAVGLDALGKRIVMKRTHALSR